MADFPSCYGQATNQLNQVPGLLRELQQLTEPSVLLPELEPGLIQQAAFFTDGVYRLYRGNRRWQRIPEPEEIRRLAMLLFKVLQFIYSREQRVADLHSETMRRMVALKESLFPLGVPYLWLCIDGRCLSKLFAGLHGKAIHTPAALNATEFLALADGSGFHLVEGQFTAMIDLALRSRPRISEFLDCHIGCAAQNQRMLECNGESSPDGGLREDVMTKLEMAQAIRRYVAERHGDPNRVATFITSFDVHSGFMYVGLDEVLNDARVQEHGFVREVLAELIGEGRIISTEALVEHEDEIRASLAGHYFEVNYAGDYLRSTEQFWETMAQLAPRLLSTYERHVRRVYPQLSHAERSDDLKQLSLVLLANTINGYLHSYTATGQRREYPYAAHEESVISVTISPQGPFDRAVAFSVYPKDPQVSAYLHLALGIIMGNRKEGRMSPFEREALQRIYDGSHQAAFNYPVPAFFFGRLSSMPTAEEIRQLREVDWSRVIDWPWRTMASAEFINALDAELLPGIPATVALAIDELRRSIVELHEPGLPAAEDLIDGRIIPVPTLTGPNREMIAVVPFLTTGYLSNGRR